jgi:diguanylate cyclase
LLTVPVATEPLHWFLDITPGLFVLIVAGGILIRRRYRASGFTNAATGLSNFNALRTNRDTGDRALIVARVLNYPQISANLPQADEPKLVEQIVSRLSIGTMRSNVYQGDEGIFAWLAEPGIAIGHHVEALHALFRNPAKVGKTAYDIAISFGVEIGSGRNIANRLSSALVAADEAAAEGLKWKYHDPERFKDEQWRLSLLAQLDQAIGRGEVWVAYQPQLDLATGRIRGAEALARWTHPEKGPISPHEFITAAEQHGRIDGLTMFMLEQAIVACAKLNRSGEPFHISVNLSARTLARRALPGEVRDLLARHRVDPKLLTLELTETAALASDGSDLDPLVRLRDLGVRISIDDYGTGLSTLEYLKKIPATEIKIDQGFIKSMNDNRSDLVMVKSTIALAHSLGRTVVAEGVESRETLDSLIAMKCDAAQGFVIGRPVSFDGLVRRLTSQSRVRAA